MVRVGEACARHREDAGVDDEQVPDPIRLLGEGADADGPAPVMHHQGDVTQVEMANQRSNRCSYIILVKLAHSYDKTNPNNDNPTRPANKPRFRTDLKAEAWTTVRVPVGYWAILANLPGPRGGTQPTPLSSRW